MTTAIDETKRREERSLLAAALARGPVELLDFLLPLWAGLALNAVDGKGRVSIPSFLRTVIERRGDEKDKRVLRLYLTPEGRGDFFPKVHYD